MAILNYVGVEVVESSKWWAAFVDERGNYHYAHGPLDTPTTVQGARNNGGRVKALEKLTEKIAKKGYVNGGVAPFIFEGSDTLGPREMIAVLRSLGTKTTTCDSSTISQFSAKAAEVVGGTAVPAPTAPRPATPKARPKLASAPAAEVYTRPNGETFHDISIDGHAGVPFMRSARAAGLRVALRGPSGCGKTALTEAAFADCVTVSCTEATEVDDFYGRLLPGEVPGTFDWEDGPLTIAASTGGVLLVDDAGWLSPGVQAVLLDVLDGRTQFTAALRPAHCGGRTVRIEPGFTVVLAWNPGQGRIIDPLLSRFALPVDCSTNFTLARALGVPADFVKLAERLDKERVNPAKELRWSPQMRDLLHAAAIAKTFGRSTGARALVGKAPEQFRGRVASEAADVLRIANLGSLETGPLEAAAV